MRKAISFALAAVVICGFSGCRGASGAEETVDNLIEQMYELSHALDGIKDDATADIALPKIESAAKNMAELGKKLKDQRPSKEETKKMDEKYKKAFEAAKKQLKDALTKAKKNAPNKVKAIDSALKKAAETKD